METQTENKNVRANTVKNPMGYMARDVLTGFSGVIDHMALYESGCRRLSLQPKMKEDGTVPDGRFVDEFQVELLSEKPLLEPAEFQEPQFSFGQKVRMKAANQTGVITGRAYYLNGCLRYEVTMEANKDGMVRERWQYAEALEAVTEKKPESSAPRKTGGVCDGGSRMKTTL